LTRNSLRDLSGFAIWILPVVVKHPLPSKERFGVRVESLK